VTAALLPSRIFNAVVIGSGALIGAVAVVMVTLHTADLGLGTFFDTRAVDLLTVFAVPMIAMMGYFPMLIGRTGGGIEIGLDSCVLIFLANVASPWEALLLWSLGTTLGQLVSDKRRATKAFNSGLGTIAGGLALLVIWAAGGGAGTDAEVSWHGLLAIGVGAAVYFAVDYLLSAT
jgi:hypothetical protein